MKTLIIFVSIYLLFSLIFIENGYTQYPYNPTNTQQKITGTIGESRGKSTSKPNAVYRYHYGLDFGAGNQPGKEVYAIETGPLRLNTTNSFAIGRIGYIHVEPNDYIKNLPS